ncbi:hypothetical protein [uncultured Fibrobacter sp.]|uniref:hypothetical protein n=1 Tax=uncultured Fibrobacter sp. TaxID=261512 RepID=UPI00262F2949|nr:hypothetical protein [uncultured Fibrobacter sp.]
MKQEENPWDLYSPYVFWNLQVDISGEYYRSLGISSYEDYCRFYEGENAVFYQSDSLLYEKYYDEETSQISKKYLTLYYCAPPKSSSSSAEESSSSESSSSFEKSSSSEESSSSELPSSSSLSSSSEESSSSSEEIIVESSSVMPVDEPFVAGADQVYTPDQIFSSGLQNMEPGVCYSLNPDRGTIYGWNISYNASDSWWWRKVDCETGKKPVEKGIGFCAAFPGSKPDKVSACYAHNGSCYVCDNSKDYIDCNADWLWNYNFPTHSWFKQVDCYDPFEGEKTEVCYEIILDDDGLSLLKQRSDDVETVYVPFNDNDKVNFINKIYNYDALGRIVAKNKMSKYGSYYTKVDMFVSEHNQFYHALKKDNVCNGYVKGVPYITWCEINKDSNGDFEVVYIEVSMHIKSDSIHKECDDERLIAHETEHKKIWDDEKNNVRDSLAVTIPKNLKTKDECNFKAEKAWPYVRDALFNMYTRHNNWDDKDTNNVSHERINISDKMRKHKNSFYNRCK